MDTRYWGPSGWRLLHTIAHAGRGPLKKFFEVLPYVLPCKYCRHNLAEHITRHPVPTAAADFPKWLWRVHNMVNAKLREQRLPTAEDPPFEEVAAFYESRLSAGCTRTTFEGWEFLFSVAEAHPFSRQGRTSTPIAGHPPAEGLDAFELNRWNLMKPEERFHYYQKFWELLPLVLPFPEWTRAWKRASKEDGGETAAKCRVDCLKGVWDIRCAMEEELELLNKTKFTELCKELQTYRSGCSTSSRGKTCRRKKSKK